MSFPFRVLELYSGIGGMHCALQESGISYEVVLAVDVNTTANQIYRHNFPDTPLSSSTIQMLTEEQLHALKIDMVLMSPPCQPFTRMGKKLDCDDIRTSSFLHFMQLLTRLESPPRYLLVENVRGFESSHTRQILLDALQQCGYLWQEFLLTPLQFGIPNSRLRYYLLAKLLPNEFVFARKSEIIKDIPEQASPFLKYRSSCRTGDASNNELCSSCVSKSGDTEFSTRKIGCDHDSLQTISSVAETTNMSNSNTVILSKDCVKVGISCDTLDAQSHECDSCNCLETRKQYLPSESSTNSDMDISIGRLNISPGCQGGGVSCNDGKTSACALCLKHNKSTNVKLSLDCLSELGLCSQSLRLTHEDDLADYPDCLSLDEFLEHSDDDGYFEPYTLTDRDLLRFVIMDVVHPSLRKCSCFTKRYRHFMEGAGSIIMMTDSIEDVKVAVSLKEQAIDLKNSNLWAEPELSILRRLRLRYFTPREIANLLCFPSSFSFLKELSMIQLYRVLGNSLNVHVVSVLINLLTMDPECSTANKS